MSPFTKKWFGPTASNETLNIIPTIPPTSHTSPYLTKSDLENIHTEIKAFNDKHPSDMKSMNNHISDMNDLVSAMLAKHTGRSYKKDKKEEKITEISSKL